MKKKHVWRNIGEFIMPVSLLPFIQSSICVENSGDPPCISCFYMYLWCFFYWQRLFHLCYFVSRQSSSPSPSPLLTNGEWLFFNTDLEAPMAAGMWTASPYTPWLVWFMTTITILCFYCFLALKMTIILSNLISAGIYSLELFSSCI